MIYRLLFYTFFLSAFAACLPEDNSEDNEELPPRDLLLGADLSYVNQILDRGGIYKDEGSERNPYEIFAAHGTDIVRLRLWHDPVWTKEVYGNAGTQLYNDLADVAKAIALAREHEMKILLDFHFADTWVDPGKQSIPEAWKNIRSIEVLEDSVYQYTFKTLKYFQGKGLLPEMVQIGNETNCGMLYTDAPAGFPSANACNGGWLNLGKIINSAITAIRDVSAETSIILHVADPKNVDWWFSNITANAGVHDFDVIGFSYYPLWHTTVPLHEIGENVEAFRTKFDKKIMILETAYPWTTEGKDGYNNLFGSQTPVNGYPFSKEGQRDLMIALAKEVDSGGGSGIIYWEPAWISTPGLKDLWGEGSSWENAAMFDFEGNVLPAMKFFDEASY